MLKTIKGKAYDAIHHCKRSRINSIYWICKHFVHSGHFQKGNCEDFIEKIIVFFSRALIYFVGCTQGLFNFYDNSKICEIDSIPFAKINKMQVAVKRLY